MDYLLSIYQPDGDPPPPEVLDDHAGRRCAERGDEGGRRLGLRRRPAPAEHGHRGARQGRRRADHRRSVRRGQGAHRRLHDHRGAGPRRGARVGPQAGPRDHAARSRCGRSRARPSTDAPACHAYRREIERVFREEYGRAVAVLVRVFGDIDIAEEAVQDAFAAAVRALAVGRPAAEPGGLDHHHRPQPGDRPPAPRGLPRRPARAGRAAARRATSRTRGGRRARRPAAPDLHLLPPGARRRPPRSR